MMISLIFLKITILPLVHFAVDFALEPDGRSVWDLEAVAAKGK